MMQDTGFIYWCKEAGPGGPCLWLFDSLINFLAKQPVNETSFSIENNNYVDKLNQLYAEIR